MVLELESLWLGLLNITYMLLFYNLLIIVYDFVYNALNEEIKVL